MYHGTKMGVSVPTDSKWINWEWTLNPTAAATAIVKGGLKVNILNFQHQQFFNFHPFFYRNIQLEVLHNFME